MRRGLLLLALVLSACPPPVSLQDSGPTDEDAGIPPTPCAAPEECRAKGLDAVCRSALCRSDVPCGDDVECGLGERCLGGQCRFTGCTADADCLTGKCLRDSYTCVECGSAADCPRDKPVCQATTSTCVGCTSDDQCPLPGPGHCSAGGACVHCLTSDHCPNGLTCNARNICEGAPLNAACPEGVACAAGLVCVTVSGVQQCLQACNVYTPQCQGTQVCFKLTYSGSASMVFESDGPIGVCFDPQPGLKGLHQSCVRTPTGTSCQGHLQCAPESASVALCRNYCNPLASGMCAAGEVCTSFVGDYSGRRYGLCMSDLGFGPACAKDSQCRAGLSCQPYDDPSASSEISDLCQFNVGAAPGLAPCAPRALSDGGVVPADRACQSGSCRADPLAVTPAYFCYSACAVDADCSVGGRTGTCEGSYDFTTPFGTMGTVKGCRPGCDSTDACGEYDAGVVCKLRVQTSGVKQNCTVSAGRKLAGVPCVAGSECRSGYCQVEDARGVRHPGLCAEPCTAAAQCDADGGAALPVTCQPTAVLAWRGPDGLAGTGDDVISRASWCSGVPCASSDDCSGGDGGVDGGPSSAAICAADLDPSQPLSALVLRCRLPVGAKRGGDPCAADAECLSGACGTLQPPSTGTGRACFEACTATSACPGTTGCRVGGLRLSTASGPVNLDSCAP